VISKEFADFFRQLRRIYFDVHARSIDAMAEAFRLIYFNRSWRLRRQEAEGFRLGRFRALIAQRSCEV
jgi:hypothetical protein